MSGHSKGSGSFNLWAFYFWFVEITFAVIGGTTEAWVYRQYMAPGQFSDAEAFARALVTQLAIVGFGAAGIKAMTSIEGWGKWPVVFLAFTFALGFALVTFDLMLVSAQAFRNAEALGAADSWPIPTPWGTIPGQQVTLFIIAGVPFFQWAMSVFGPVITKDRKPLSAEEIKAKGEADLALIEMNARKRLAQAKSFGATFAAAKAAVTQSATQGVSDVQSLGIGGANHAGYEGATQGVSDVQSLGIGGANHAGYEGATQGVSDGQDTPQDGLPPGVRKLRPASKGPWLKDDMVAYVALAYPGVTISEPAALEAIKEAGKGAMKGKAYSATITQAKAWAKRHYGEPRGEVDARQERARREANA